MDITRIDLMIAQKQLQNVPLFQQAMGAGGAATPFCRLVERRWRALPHSHLFALLEMAKQLKVENVFVHCFMDGAIRRQTAGAITCASCSRKCANWE